MRPRVLRVPVTLVGLALFATLSGGGRAASSADVAMRIEGAPSAARVVATSTTPPVPPAAPSTMVPATTAAPPPSSSAPAPAAPATSAPPVPSDPGDPAPADDAAAPDATTTTAPPAPAPTTTSPPVDALPAAGRNGPGHFSGRILRDGRPLPGVTVKVVNIATPGWPRPAVLDSLGGHDGVDVFVTTTDAAGDWSVRGLDATKQFMLKVFPPSLCDAFAEIAPEYTTAEAGYIDVQGNPFPSTRSAPGAGPYQRWSSGRFLFDMPVHVFPTVPGALEGGRGYSDLNIRFWTRHGTFATSAGPVTGCTV